jgi:arylsulfatase A-like enzyme
MSEPLLQKRWPWVVGALAIALAYAVLSFEPALHDPRPPGSASDIEALAERDDLNVLFILIDTLRSDRLSGYGYERETSPTLDALAKRGARFHRHLAQSSWTKASMASLWTGLEPTRVGITRFDQVLPDQAVLPAEIFRDAGFRTAALYRNGWVSPYFGFSQGFEVYQKPIGKAPTPEVRRENPTIQDDRTDEDAINGAIEFLRVWGRERWFLYLHLMDVHEYVYDEETALFGTSFSDVYDNSILRTNRVLDRLLIHLIEEGYLENTLIVIGSDHGEAFNERGLEGHARYVYKESTEVPFILGFPFRLERPAVIETRTANVDIWPTVLDLVGLPPLPETDGRSRKPEILAAARGEAFTAEPSKAFAYLDQTWGREELAPTHTVAVTEGPHRYVFVDSSRRDIEVLFDAGADPAELENRIDDEPEIASRLREAAQTYMQQPPVWEASVERLEMDEMELNQLRALGYAID